MTEPYPSTEVESKLKHLFRSLTRAHRAYKGTRNHALTLLHRASAAVLTAVLVYKALTYLLFLPAMNGIWSLTLRCSPVNYLTNNNAHQIFTSPTILGGIVLIVLLAAFWNLYGFSILLHGFALACRGETLRPVSLFVRSLGDIRHVLLPKNWPILLYCALLIPFTDVFVTYNYISQLAVPEYILGLVRAKPLYLVLFLLILGAAFLFTLFWVLVLPLFTLERNAQTAGPVCSGLFRSFPAGLQRGGADRPAEHPRHAAARPCAVSIGDPLLRLFAGLQGHHSPVHHHRIPLRSLP